jgi:hypothetical protein
VVGGDFTVPAITSQRSAGDKREPMLDDGTPTYFLFFNIFSTLVIFIDSYDQHF